VGRWLGYRRVVGESLADLTDLFKERFIEILTEHSPEERSKWGLGAGSADFLGDWNARKGADKTGVFNLLQEGAYLSANPKDVTKTFSEKMSTFDPSNRKGFFDHAFGGLATGFDMTPADLAGQFNTGITAAQDADPLIDVSYQGTTADDLFGYLSSMVPTTEVNAALSAEAASNTGLLSLDEDFDEDQGFYE